MHKKLVIQPCSLNFNSMCIKNTVLFIQKGKETKRQKDKKTKRQKDKKTKRQKDK